MKFINLLIYHRTSPIHIMKLKLSQMRALHVRIGPNVNICVLVV